MTGDHRKLLSQIGNIVSKVLQSKDSAIIEEVLRAQGTEIIQNSLREQIDDMVVYSFLVQAVNIVRTTVAKQEDDAIKGLVDSIFPPTSAEWVCNEMV